MNQLRTTGSLSPQTLESLVLRGDLSGLMPQQKVEYACYRAQQLGLDPAAKPFEIMRLNGKEVLYATAGLTQQLCASQNLSVSFPQPSERIEDVVMVTARVTDGKGRSTENVGAVGIGSLKGDALANALMKARTKAIRRTVLAHCGLGMLDETEVETIPGAVVEKIPVVEYTRPGDAEPVVVEPEPEEWTEEERNAAKTDLMDFAEVVCADHTGWTIDNPKIQATLKKFRDQIGSGTYSNWLNRLTQASERALKAAPGVSTSRPSTDTSGEGLPPKKPTDSAVTSVSSSAVEKPLEEMSLEELKSLRADLWVQVWKLWDSKTIDGRKLVTTHRQNRTRQRKVEWTAGLAQDSKEYLICEIDGLRKELTGE